MLVILVPNTDNWKLLQQDYQIICSFSLSILLEEVDDIEITLDGNRPANGFSLSSPNVILSHDFDSLASETVDHRDVSYTHFLLCFIILRWNINFDNKLGNLKNVKLAFKKYNLVLDPR